MLLHVHDNGKRLNADEKSLKSQSDTVPLASIFQEKLKFRTLPRLLFSAGVDRGRTRLVQMAMTFSRLGRDWTKYAYLSQRYWPT